MSLKEKFINSLSEILGFEAEIKDNKVKINQYLDFGSYKINNWYKKDFENVLNQSINKIQDNEKIYSWILDFFALYYNGGDFGYLKSRFDSFKYKVSYNGKDTDFFWNTKDCYMVKTKDVENKIKVGLLDNEIIFEKQIDEDKKENEIEIIKEKEFLKVIFYNVKVNKGGLSKDKIKYLKSKLQEFGLEYIVDDKFKQLLTDFLNKWGKDYFIHKNLKGFLKEELSYFIYQKIGLEEYVYINKEKYFKLNRRNNYFTK